LYDSTHHRSVGNDRLVDEEMLDALVDKRGNSLVAARKLVKDRNRAALAARIVPRDEQRERGEAIREDGALQALQLDRTTALDLNETRKLLVGENDTSLFATSRLTQ
jgi:hypothetical protein